MKTIKRVKTTNILIAVAFAMLFYSIVGTCERVPEIKARAPIEMKDRNWKILRYEGYRFGSWGDHGGRVWYHVANIDNPSIQYRVYVTLWNNELHYTYGKPEQLSRVELKYTTK